MRFLFCVVALTLGATVKARPGGTGDYGLEGNGRYFENNLDNLQGALEDISKAGEDLEIIETKLEAIVDGSALVFKAESVLENAVAKTVYTNAWKSVAQCSTNKFESQIDFCNDWCNTKGKWGCGEATLKESDSRNTDGVDYQCDCTGCNGC